MTCIFSNTIIINGTKKIDDPLARFIFPDEFKLFKDSNLKGILFFNNIDVLDINLDSYIECLQLNLFWTSTILRIMAVNNIDKLRTIRVEVYL